MTARPPARDDIAAAVRRQRRRAVDLMCELVHRRWHGDPRHDQVLATLYRVCGHLDAAAARLARKEQPTLREMQADFVALLVFPATVTAALLAVPGPVGPTTVTAVVAAALAAVSGSAVTVRVISRRRQLSGRPPLTPLLPASDPVEAAVTTALLEVHAGIVAILPDGDPPVADDWAYALDQMNAARSWLAYTLASREATT